MILETIVRSARHICLITIYCLSFRNAIVDSFQVNFPERQSYRVQLDDAFSISAFQKLDQKESIGSDRLTIILALRNDDNDLYTNNDDLDDDDDDDDDDDENDEDSGTDFSSDFRSSQKIQKDLDWRLARAKLIMQDRIGTQQPGQASSLSSTNADYRWTYDAGTLIEKGCLLVSKPSATVSCDDLLQPYFHKSIILILDHYYDGYDKKDKLKSIQNSNIETLDEIFSGTRGIILNRQSNLVIDSSDIVFYDNGEDNQDEEEGGDDCADDDKVISNATRRNYSWNVSFGGNVAGLHDDSMPISDNTSSTILWCLHNITTDLAHRVSDVILQGSSNGIPSQQNSPILLTNIDGARRLLDAGDAKSTDEFHVYCGICSWDHGQLEEEIDDGLWVLLASDTQTIWNDIIQRADVITNKPDANTSSHHEDVCGFDVWSNVIQKVEKYDVEMPLHADHNSFSDLMLKEWINEKLLWESDNVETVAVSDRTERNSTVLSNAAVEDSTRDSGLALGGSVIRSSNKDPFLLQDQFLHMSTILIYQDEPTHTIGLVLNLPTNDTYTTTTKKGNTVSFVVRYGGPSADDDEDYDDEDFDDLEEDSAVIDPTDDSIIWLHLSRTLRELGIGRPVGSKEGSATHLNRQSSTPPSVSKVWTCSYEQVIRSIDAGWALPREFMLIRGYTLWEKESGSADEDDNDYDDESNEDDEDKDESDGDGDGDGGIQDQIDAGYFEIVAPDIFGYVWPLLLSQDYLSSEKSVDNNLKVIKNAWHLGGLKPSVSNQRRDNEIDSFGGNNDRSIASSIALKQAIIDQTTRNDLENSSQEPKQYVYGSKVEISELKYEALRVWMNLYLLDNTEYRARRF